MSVKPVISAKETRLHQLSWTLADSWTIARRDIQHWRMQPATIMLGWFFPIMIVLMFGGLFGGAILMPDGGEYFEFLMPGMFAINMLFGLEATVIAVTTDVSRGVTDRFRSMPISSAAVVLGRCIADMLNSMVGLAIMIGCGWLLGWRWHGGVLDAISAVGLLLLLRFALLWVGILIGLAAQGSEAVTAVQILVWPIGFLSSVFVDPATMPDYLGTIAQWNPVSVTAAATRQLFQNPGWQTSDAWIARNALLMAVVLPLISIMIFLPLAARKYRHLNR